MSKLLNALGLMRVSEHERALQVDEQLIAKLATDRDLWKGRFNTAASDLSVQADRITRLSKENERLVRDYAVRGELIAGARTTVITLEQEIGALRHDAQKWRDYLKRSRDRKAGKKS